MLELLYSDGLDLTQNALRQSLHSYAASGGLGSEVLCVNLVECGEIAHVSQEAGGLEHLVVAAAHSLQDRAYVLAALLSLSSDSL